jgi:hypothetical protein
MGKVPLYLKTDPGMPRPQDPEYYLMAKEGMYFCRNHQFFESDVRTDRTPAWLQPHRPQCRLGFPRLGKAALEYMVGFFGNIYDRHGSESIVFLLWSQDTQRYRFLVPEQEATVWIGPTGNRSAQDVRYELPRVIPPRHLLIGDFHCHGDHAAYTSWTDRRDEHYRDGLHGIVGNVEKEPPDFHLEFAVDGERFQVDAEEFFRGYDRRRRIIPREWIDRVRVKAQGPQWTSTWRGAR